jgi:hypothetical protein
LTVHRREGEREERDGVEARTDLVVGEGHPYFEGGLESDHKNLKQKKLALHLL